jgi:putative tryptophan/tyrosine transport system substrate-binding protein
MRRRDFIKSIAASAAPWPVVARARQSDGPRRIGVLMITAENVVDQLQAVDQIRKRLEGLGWVDGRDCRLEIRWAEGKPDKAAAIAKEFVVAQCDVIVAQGSITVKILQRETSSIPIVFWLVPDPVGEGFVGTLAHPGGNITGFTNYETTIVTKWLNLLKEINPQITRISALFDPEIAPFYERFIQALSDAASSFHVAVSEMRAYSAPEIQSKMAAFAEESKLTGGLLVLPDALTVGSSNLIVGLAAHLRVPAIYPYRGFVNAGGLLSYGVNLPNHAGETAAYVDRILKGEKAAELPVQAPTKYELIVNLTTAHALGLSIPQTLLATADEVIE